MGASKKGRIQEILKELNIYQTDFLECTENCGEYIIARKSGGEMLFCGSLDGCVVFLENYKLQTYEHITRLWHSKGMFSPLAGN